MRFRPHRFRHRGACVVAAGDESARYAVSAAVPAHDDVQIRCAVVVVGSHRWRP